MTCGVVHKKYIYFDSEFSRRMRLANTKEKVNEITSEFEVSYKLYRNNNNNNKGEENQIAKK